MTAVETGYRGPQVCAITGLSYRQLDYWARTKLLVPSVADASGSGRVRVYSLGDVVKLAVVKQLLDTGMSLQRVRGGLSGVDLLDGSVLVITSEYWRIASTGEEVLAALRDAASLAHVVRLDKVRRGVIERARLNP